MTSNAEFEVFFTLIVVVGIVGACFTWFGARGAYEQIGRGYLDVSDLDPAAPDSVEDQLEETRQLIEALRARRAARRQAATGELDGT